LLADEVESIYPEFVDYDEYGELEGINYSKMVSVLIQGIKELNKKIEDQQDQIDIIKKKI
jgi:hypothetical protein